MKQKKEMNCCMAVKASNGSGLRFTKIPQGIFNRVPFCYLSLQQKCNKSLALTYFLLVYYGPGVTATMYVHIQLGCPDHNLFELVYSLKVSHRLLVQALL